MTSKSEIFASCSARIIVSRAVEIGLDGIGNDLAVIEQRFERRRRHRVDRIGPDDGLDVHEIGIARVLR